MDGIKNKNGQWITEYKRKIGNNSYPLALVKYANGSTSEYIHFNPNAYDVQPADLKLSNKLDSSGLETNLAFGILGMCLAISDSKQMAYIDIYPALDPDAYIRFTPISFERGANQGKSFRLDVHIYPSGNDYIVNQKLYLQQADDTFQLLSTFNDTVGYCQLFRLRIYPQGFPYMDKTAPISETPYVWNRYNTPNGILYDEDDSHDIRFYLASGGFPNTYIEGLGNLSTAEFRLHTQLREAGRFYRNSNAIIANSIIGMKVDSHPCPAGWIHYAKRKNKWETNYWS
ncbi:MAG: hypothetical protein ACOX24_08360 [Christensenellales bacterium]|jgi:hypothetical protein